LIKIYPLLQLILEALEQLAGAGGAGWFCDKHTYLIFSENQLSGFPASFV